MIEGNLVNYGVLGLWTAYQIYKETTLHKELITTLQDLKSTMKKCQIKNS